MSPSCSVNEASSVENTPPSTSSRISRTGSFSRRSARYTLMSSQIAGITAAAISVRFMRYPSTRIRLIMIPASRPIAMPASVPLIIRKGR